MERIGWRNTQIRELAKATVFVPNSKLVQNNIVNFHTRDNDSTILVQLRVHYSNDPEKVEQVTCAVAREVLKSQCNHDADRDTIFTLICAQFFCGGFRGDIKVAED